MAGFLPNLDGLQKILKSDTTFKEKLEMAKMGKSRQLAEMYLPALMNAKSFEEAQQIQGMVTTEAAKYGLDDLTAKINPMFDTKVKEFDKQEKTQRAEGKYKSLITSYGNSEVYNHFKDQVTTGAQFVSDWKDFVGSNAPLVVEDLEEALKNNVIKSEDIATPVGTYDNGGIIIGSIKKSNSGKNFTVGKQLLRYDEKTNNLWFDANKDNVMQPEEVDYEANLMPGVGDAIQKFKADKNKAIDVALDRERINLGYMNYSLESERFNYTKLKDAEGKDNITFTPTGAKQFKYDVIGNIQNNSGAKETLKNIGKLIKDNPKGNLVSSPDVITELLGLNLTNIQLEKVMAGDQSAITQLNATLSSFNAGVLNNLLRDITTIINEGMVMRDDNNTLIKFGDNAWAKILANDLYGAVMIERYANISKPLPENLMYGRPYTEENTNANYVNSSKYSSIAALQETISNRYVKVPEPTKEIKR